MVASDDFVVNRAFFVIKLSQFDLFFFFVGAINLCDVYLCGSVCETLVRFYLLGTFCNGYGNLFVWVLA